MASSVDGAMLDMVTDPLARNVEMPQSRVRVGRGHTINKNSTGSSSSAASNNFVDMYYQRWFAD